MATLQVYATKLGRRYLRECDIIDGYVTVIFDKEDEPAVNAHKWTMNNYGGVKTTIGGKQISLTQVIMDSYTKEQQKEMYKGFGDRVLWELDSPYLGWMQDNTAGDGRFDYRKKNIGWAIPF